MKNTQTELQLSFAPLTMDCWDAFEQLFGKRGACGGCWCMWFRLTNDEFKRQKGEANRAAMKSLVKAGHIPGILAFHDDTPVGWCSVAPRQEFPRLQRSRVSKAVDEQPVWSIVCFFIAKTYRGKGVATHLLEEAVAFAAKQGGTIVEGYPLDPKRKMPDVFAYHGLVSSFRQVGFEEVARRSANRPIMRYIIDSGRAKSALISTK
jgi:GNAT superfamily N-acetyltransferase